MGEKMEAGGSLRTTILFLYVMSLMEDLKTRKMISGGYAQLTRIAREDAKWLHDRGFRPTEAEIHYAVDYLRSSPDNDKMWDEIYAETEDKK